MRGHVAMDPFYMDIGIFSAWAVASVDAELEHSEPIGKQKVAELNIVFPVFACFSGQIKEYKYPHNSIFTESFVHLIFYSGTSG